MANDANTGGGLTAAQLLKSLQVRPFCDDNSDQGLSPEQEAALHAFMHEMMAAYYRMRMVVPEQKALTVLDRRFATAAKEKLRR